MSKPDISEPFDVHATMRFRPRFNVGQVIPAHARILARDGVTVPPWDAVVVALLWYGKTPGIGEYGLFLRYLTKPA